jgi:pimeloyl-ACP methyl ester carboxylesterase
MSLGAKLASQPRNAVSVFTRLRFVHVWEVAMTGWALTQSVETAAGTVRWDRMGSGPPLVLVHGTPTRSDLWRDVAPVLARDYTVYVYDLPGYGQSAKGDGQDVSMGMQGRVLAELIGHWGLDAPLIAGHDIGGGIALRAHLLHGVDFGRMALLDTLAMRPRGGGRWGTPFSRHVRAHGAEAFAELPGYLFEGVMRAYLATAVARPMAEATFQAFLAPFTGATGQAAFFRQLVQLDEAYTDEIERRLDQVRAPVDLIWGTEDTWLDLDFAARLHAAIPESTLTWIDGAGHFVQVDAPGAVTLALRRVLAGGPAA